jgi:hypothetical protein
MYVRYLGFKGRFRNVGRPVRVRKQDFAQRRSSSTSPRELNLFAIVHRGILFDLGAGDVEPLPDFESSFLLHLGGTDGGT